MKIIDRIIHAYRSRKALAEHNRGFTLVEMMVSVGIFVIITALLTMNYGRFNEDILISNLAYDVALSIREAQSYGINVRQSEEVGGAVSRQFKDGYGILLISRHSENMSYILFKDDRLSGVGIEGVYDDNGIDSMISRYDIKRGYTISRLCMVTSTTCDEVEQLSIVFARPEPDAIIVNENYQYGSMARITVSTPRGNSRDIVVRASGQISVGK